MGFSNSQDLEQVREFFWSHFDVAKNCCKQPRPNDFIRMDWYRRDPTVGVLKKVVTSADEHNHKACAPERANQIFGFQSWKLGHTATCCIPTSSREAVGRPSTSRHNSITS